MKWYKPHRPGMHKAREQERKVGAPAKVGKIYERSRKASERLRPLPEAERPPRPRSVPYKPDPRTSRRPVPMRPEDYHDGPVIDNKTGRRVPPPQKPFGHSFQPPATRVKFPRLPGSHPAIDIIPTLAENIFPSRTPLLPPRLPTNYYWCVGPVAFPPALRYDTPQYFQGGGSCNINVPITGQSNPQFPGVGMGLNGPRHYLTRDYTTPGNLKRRAVVGTAERSAAPVGQQVPAALPSVSIGPDPNLIRRLPPPPGNDWFYDKPKNTVRRQKAFNPPDANDRSASSASPAPAREWHWETPPISVNRGISTDNVVSPNPNTNNPPHIPPQPPATRSPPGQGIKERKGVSRAARLGIMLFRALDELSELAELIDALYDALPDDVKKRWDRPDRLGDTFGQYGLEGADWKLQALYHNWHRVDVEKAIRNIIKNHLSDKVIGAMQRGLPVNTGQAHASGEMEFAQWLDKLLDRILDEVT